MSAEQDNYKRVKAFAINQGICLFGVADVAPIQDSFHIESQKSLVDLNRGISIAARLSDGARKSDLVRVSRRYDHKFIAVDGSNDSLAGYVIKDAVA